jgi:3-isopropylmalate/(R)-2-methylmalate dehydratase small subunit
VTMQEAPASAFDWKLRGRCYRLGHDVPHMGGVVPMRIVSEMRYDPKDIVPQLFAETDPGFHERCRPGDIIVTGRNFGMGPKMQGYIAMQALGLGLVCESMPFLAYREAIGIGLPVLTDCPEATDLCSTGDDLEVDFAAGRFINHTRGVSRDFPPVPQELREIVAVGGTTNWLKQWWANKRTTECTP